MPYSESFYFYGKKLYHKLRCVVIEWNTSQYRQLSRFIDKNFFETLMNYLMVSAFFGVGNNHELIESRIFNLIFPDKQRVLLHNLHERDLFAFTFSFVWVHNNDWNLVFNCPFYLGYHRSKFKSIIQAKTLYSDTSPHITHTLDQN